MKALNNIFVLAIAATLTTFQAAKADDNLKTKETAPATYNVGMYVSKNTSTINVMVEKQAGSTVKVSIKDEAGKVLATQSLNGKEERTWTKFNLSQLNDGTYTVEVSNGKEVTVKEVKLATPKFVEPIRTINVQ
ncbi:T9SS type A sorting domain-containing protein [Arsenicibacter rosenii]|uniref:Secretion system C-terminal sorting domain-containing protein n=1 Tax=Arsenicibacter rosenii TaxID=1750698 RepID=A0A1S2VBI1_9BACT|nr:T9SS type A sorting domain-containing protein [Arsenicibacter rosenii]OIN55576.1 hypothetical protein BLX24_29385 [Arsenicibacter rosenii]